jgi:hypothetical protein
MRCSLIPAAARVGRCLGSHPRAKVCVRRSRGTDAAACATPQISMLRHAPCSNFSQHRGERRREPVRGICHL